MNLKNILGEKQDEKVRTKDLSSRIQVLLKYTGPQSLPCLYGALIPPQKHLSAQS